jgi:hypothetical protein
MRYVILCIMLAQLDGPNQEPKMPPDADAAKKLLARMTDPSVSFDDRHDAEDELVKLAPEAVLPLVLPHVGKGMPKGGIWNSLGTREHERTGPVHWQIWYAVNRVWSKEIDRVPAAKRGEALLGLLNKVAKGDERYYVIYALTHDWDPCAEADVAKLLRDPAEASKIRLVAGLALILHGKESYRDVLLAAAAKGDLAERERWFELLSDPRYKQRMGSDARVVRLGFELIEAERAKTPDFIHGAYFLALNAGRYVGEEFAPSPHDPRYRGQGRLTDQYFIDTVDNAQRWWAKNRPKDDKK